MRGLAAYGPDENELIVGRGIDYEIYGTMVGDDGRPVLLGRLIGQDAKPSMGWECYGPTIRTRYSLRLPGRPRITTLKRHVVSAHRRLPPRGISATIAFDARVAELGSPPVTTGDLAEPI